MTALEECRPLVELEIVIEQGLATFVEVGQALLEIRDRRLYLDGYTNFDDYCRERWHFNRQRASQLIQAAEVSKFLDSPPQRDSQARELAPLLAQPLTMGDVWREAVAQYGDKVTAANVRELVRRRSEPAPLIDGLDDDSADLVEDDGEEDGDRPYSTKQFILDQVEGGVDLVHALEYALDDTGEPEPPAERDRLAPLMTSDSPEWYTPRHIVERVVKTLGAIDLDPCADPGKRIPAARHFTAADDGLSKRWTGRVYMNPPYGRGIEAWVAQLCDAFVTASVRSAVALVPARTDTDWWQLLSAYPVCFIHGRLKFSEHENSAPFPSAAVYLGHDLAAFVRAFSDIGAIYERVTG